MHEGKVKFFDDKKGWGFVNTDGSTDDIFVHYSQIEGNGRKTLKTGQRIRFEVQNSQRGLMAMKVTKI